MFEYIHLKNFKSFSDVNLDFTDRHGNPKKMILIYGENGIGKSNLASAFFMLAETMRTMDVRDLMQSILSNRPEGINEEAFFRAFKMRYKDLQTLISENKMVASDDPLLIDIGFRINGKAGKYLIEMDDHQLIHERLEYTLAKNRGPYYDIYMDNKTISARVFKDKSAYSEVKHACDMFWGKHSLLSILLHESEDKSSSFIRNQLTDNFLDVLDFLARVSCKVKFGSSQERGGILLPREIFRDFERGSVLLKDEPLLERTERMLNLFFRDTSRDIVRMYYKREVQEHNVKYVLMEEKLIAGKEREIEFSLESTGTQFLLQLLPYMLVAVDGSVSVIDEFDTGAHDLRVQQLIQSLYKSLTGQLIITTHNTLLMESSIPKECIYVINELSDGSKEIKPITFYDPKIHENTNIRNQYLKGVYRGIPNSHAMDFAALLSTLLEVPKDRL